MTRQLTYSARFRRNYVTVFAVALFFLMVASEIALAVSIPAYMNRENVMAEELLRRETLLRFDALRGMCAAISGGDEVLMLEKQLIANALDNLAIYLRTEASNLTSEEIGELNRLTREVERILHVLRSGRSFSRENRLDSSAYIDALVAKYAGKETK
ncbi:MAG: hypothetical protein MR051_07875 [Lentisphaeria bacterium]|nr:hypothetical protein [Lentisphaeria bacterium]